MKLDPTVNLFKSQLTGLPYGTGDTSLTISSGDGSKLPDPSVDGQFNLVIWDSAEGSPSDAENGNGVVEIVRVTAISTDTLTVQRAEEGTTAQSYSAGNVYSVILALTDKTVDNINTGLVKVPVTDSITNTDSPYTLSGVDVLFADTSGGDIDVNLPAVSTLIGAETEIPIKIYKNDWEANIINLLPNGSETINGMSKYSLIDAQQSVELYPTTNGWILI